MTPQRIQLRRVKDWRLPDGAVVVGRPGKWGNPFSLMDIGRAYPSLTDWQVAQMAVNQFRDLIRVGHPITHSVRQPDGSRRAVTYTYPSIDDVRAELAGHDLACWCDLGEPCHADVLLEVANR